MDRDRSACYFGDAVSLPWRQARKPRNQNERIGLATVYVLDLIIAVREANHEVGLDSERVRHNRRRRFEKALKFRSVSRGDDGLAGGIPPDCIYQSLPRHWLPSLSVKPTLPGPRQGKYGLNGSHASGHPVRITRPMIQPRGYRR
jgi:hypothetical protein